MLLESGGYSVCEASDCELSFKGLASEFFDIVIVSDEVPESEQQQLIHAAKKANPSMVVVVLQQGTRSEQSEFSRIRQVDSGQSRTLLDTIDHLRRKNATR